jgi:hypothetical protein
MRIAVGVGAWLLGVGAATGGSLLAVSLLGQGIATNNTQQLTAAAVTRALASESSEAPSQGVASLPIATPSPVRSSRTRPPTTPPPQTEVTPSGRPASADPTASHSPHPTGSASATPSPSPSPSPTQSTPPPTVLTSQGGSVVAQCLPGGAYLLSWSPTQGYEAGQVLRGPAPTVQVAFQSYANTVTMVVSCSTGVPTATITVTNGYGGGGGHDE